MLMVWTVLLVTAVTAFSVALDLVVWVRASARETVPTAERHRSRC